MFRINEIFPDENTVIIQVEGRIDQKSTESLQDICNKHIQTAHRRVLIDFQGFLHMSNEGKRFLEEIRNQVAFTNIPEFLKLELGLEE